GKLTDEGLAVLSRMLQDRSKNGDVNRREAARVLGVIDRRLKLHKQLTALLNDASTDVRKAAIESAGKLRDMEFIEPLIGMLENPRLRKWARSALANYKNHILPALQKTLADPGRSLHIKKSIPRLLYQIRTEKSWRELFDILDQTDVTIRYAAIKSLNKIRKSWPDWHFDQSKIREILMEEIRNYYWKLNIFFVYARKDKLFIDVREVDDILYLALTEKLDETLERIFRLLALLYSQQDIYNSYYYLTNGNADEKANALEFLDNSLQKDLMVPLLPILDDIPLGHKIRQGRALFNLRKMTRKEALLALLEERDLWLEVCAVYSLYREKIADFNHEIEKRLYASEPILREMAEKYIKTFSFHLKPADDYVN
ncbi:MAG: HEAT repeat domain-containing protein, partial [bacterium]